MIKSGENRILAYCGFLIFEFLGILDCIDLFVCCLHLDLHYIITYSYIFIVDWTSYDFKIRKEVRIISVSETIYVGCCLKILNHHILFFICTSLFLSYTINFVLDLESKYLLVVHWLLVFCQNLLCYILLCVLVPSCWDLEPIASCFVFVFCVLVHSCLDLELWMLE